MVNRVALLVDGDNISPQHASRLLGSAKGAGRLDVARVYLDTSKPSDWRSRCELQTVHAGSGKNAADVLLAIEAAELAMERGIDTFVLASSDGDFCHIARWLRERGCGVIGRGEDKTPKQFRAACTSFMPLQEAQPKTTSLSAQVKAVIKAHGQKGAGLQITTLNQIMRHEHEICISEQPEKNWRNFLSARGQLFDLDDPAPDARVRLRGN